MHISSFYKTIESFTDIWPDQRYNELQHKFNAEQIRLKLNKKTLWPALRHKAKENQGGRKFYLDMTTLSDLESFQLIWAKQI